MIWALLVWCTMAWAEPSAAVLRQQDVVEAAAQAVAQARAHGARRAEVAELMRAYRAEATALEALRAPSAPSAEATRRAQQAAVAALAEALAAGKTDREARQVLTDWLGEEGERLDVLRRAVADTHAAPDTVRQGVLLDVSEQAAALSVALAYDAASALAAAEKAELQATALRRTGPGQSTSIGSEVDAVRLDTEAASARLQHHAANTLRDDVLALRAQVTPLLESP